MMDYHPPCNHIRDFFVNRADVSKDWTIEKREYTKVLP